MDTVDRDVDTKRGTSCGLLHISEGVMGLGQPSSLDSHKPEAYEFPFDAANAALKRLVATIAGYRAFAREHDQAVAEAYVDFRGPRRQSFEKGFLGGLDRVRSRVRALEAQRDELERMIRTARRLQEQREEDRRAWERRQADGAARRSQRGGIEGG